MLGDRATRDSRRDPDPELEKLRLGRLSLAEMFRVAIDGGTPDGRGRSGHYDCSCGWREGTGCATSS